MVGSWHGGYAGYRYACWANTERVGHGGSALTDGAGRVVGCAAREAGQIQGVLVMSAGYNAGDGKGMLR